MTDALCANVPVKTEHSYSLNSDGDSIPDSLDGTMDDTKIDGNPFFIFSLFQEAILCTLYMLVEIALFCFLKGDILYVTLNFSKQLNKYLKRTTGLVFILIFFKTFT